jgi:hypothetical protein
MHNLPLVPVTILVGNPKAFHGFEKCSCVHVDEKPYLAYGVGVERDANQTTIRTLCLECARVWSERMHITTMQCDYCQERFAKDIMLTWMPFSASVAHGDQPMLVCPSCAISSESLREDYAYDELLKKRILHPTSPEVKK